MALHSFYFDVIYFQFRWRHCRNMELVKFGRGLGRGRRFCWLEHLQIWNWITSKRKDKRKWWRDAPPWVCFKARNGIRYTFYFVPFSNFGTYSAHTVWKIGGARGAQILFILELGRRELAPHRRIRSRRDPFKRKKRIVLASILAFDEGHTNHELERTTCTLITWALVGFADSLVNLQALLAFHAIASKFVSTSKSC